MRLLLAKVVGRTGGERLRLVAGVGVGLSARVPEVDVVEASCRLARLQVMSVVGCGLWTRCDRYGEGERRKTGAVRR